MVTVRANFVEFSFFRPDARVVFVVGGFNEWRADMTPMFRGADGCWRLRMRMPAGTFRFRYCADGKWFTDYAACGVDIGPYGLDSIVQVGLASPETEPVAVG